VQANGITTLQEYLKVARTGRGRTLTKPQRGKIWKVFEEYCSDLWDKGKHEWLQVIQETRKYLERKPGILPYRGAAGEPKATPPVGPLQIIVFTCHPEWFDDGKATVINLEDPEIMTRFAV